MQFRLRDVLVDLAESIFTRIVLLVLSFIPETIVGQALDVVWC